MLMVTTREALAVLNVKRAKFFALIKEGVLPKPLKGFGNQNLFDLEQLLHRLSVQTQTPLPAEAAVQQIWAGVLILRHARH